VRALLLPLAVVVVGCKPSPDDIEFTSVTHSIDGHTTSMTEGDVMVLQTRPLDDNDDLNLCVTATSSAPNVLSVTHVVDKCRVFALSGTGVGHAVVTFRARDGASTLEVEVTSP
jgi:hypothetical protein